MIRGAERGAARHLLGLALLLAGAWAHAAEDTDATAKELLQRMMEALRNLEYSGTFVYLHGTRLETLQITHAVREGQELERLVSLNGSAREVRRDRQAVTCVMPDSKAVSVDPRGRGAGLWPTLGPDLGRLERVYRLYPLGESRIAGRAARAVGIIPKDRLRYGYRFFLDRDTALPLKTDLMDENAHPLEQIMFTSLSLAPVDTAGSAMPEDFRRLVHQAPADEPPDRPRRWAFQGLPAGFALHLSQHWQGDQGQMVEHLVLSDGLASVSVYLETASGDGLRGPAHVGAVHAWGTTVDGHQVTAVGEVPRATVRVIAESVHRQETAP